MSLDRRRATAVLAASLAGVVVVTYAVAAAGSPFVGTLDAFDGVHLEADYIEGSSVDVVPKFEGPEGCDDALLLNFEDATVSGAALYAEIPEPMSDGSTAAGFELAADEYDVGSVQLLVSRLNAEYDAGMSVSPFEGDENDGLSVSGDGFRFDNITTRVYGFGSGWFDAPFIRTDYQPEAGTVDEFRC